MLLYQYGNSHNKDKTVYNHILFMVECPKVCLYVKLSLELFEYLTIYALLIWPCYLYNGTPYTQKDLFFILKCPMYLIIYT